jgi:hypothetical protein
MQKSNRTVSQQSEMRGSCEYAAACFRIGPTLLVVTMGLKIAIPLFSWAWKDFNPENLGRSGKGKVGQRNVAYRRHEASPKASTSKAGFFLQDHDKHLIHDLHS